MSELLIQETEDERRDRLVWTEKHRRQVLLMEKAFSGMLTLAGIGMVVMFEGIAQSVGIGVLAVGVYNFFPDIRPFLSNLADRVPFLASKTDK